MEKLFNAALYNQTEVLREYLRFGNVNICDDKHNSLLHYAAMGNAMEVANLLLDNYINLDIQNSNGETPLFLAVTKGELGFCKLLCRYGANGNLVNKYGESVYFKAILKGRKDILDLLSDSLTINYELVNEKGENALHYALKVFNNDLFFELAFNYPHLIYQRDYSNANLLMHSIKLDNFEVFKYLFSHDFNIYECDFMNNNLLFYAAKYASVDILKLILDKKPIIEGKNKDGLDIFDLCKENSHPTYFLIDNYKNSFDYVQYRKTYPFHIAVVERNYDLLEYANVDIKKRDINGLLLSDLIKLVNDQSINKIFKIQS